MGPLLDVAVPVENVYLLTDKVAKSSSQLDLWFDECVTIALKCNQKNFLHLHRELAEARNGGGGYR